MIENITVDTFDLSSTDEMTGLRNTAKVYWVDGINRPLPLAQLVMAICLERAASKENDVVVLMNKITSTTKKIEELSWIENILVGFADSGIPCKKIDGGPDYELYACEWYSIIGADPSKLPEGCWGYANVTPKGGIGRWTEWLQNVHGINPFPVDLKAKTYSAADVNKVLDAIDTKLDSLNTTSQKDMILLQSETTKRDQTYDLITAMVKSISGANASIAASMR